MTVTSIWVPDASTDGPQSLMFEQYLERLHRKKASPYTLRGVRSVTRRYDHWLRERGLTAETATMGDVEEYIDSLALSDSSKVTHLSYLKAAYSYATRRGTVRNNPAIDVITAEPDPREPRIISNAELRRMRDRISLDRDWLWFHTLAFTGMRRHEVVGLRWDDGRADGSVVKLDEQIIRVLGKGKKFRVVPIHPVLHECFEYAKPAPGKFVIASAGKNGLSSEAQQDMVKRISDVYTPHDFRRTVATSLRRNGADWSVISRIMGWVSRESSKDIFMTHYNNVANSELHRGILRLYADDPIS